MDYFLIQHKQTHACHPIEWQDSIVDGSKGDTMERPDRTREGAFTRVFQMFGRRLRQMRIKAGFTQESAASELEVSSQTIRNWESGRHEPSAAHLQRLANLYGGTADELLEGPWTTSAQHDIAATVDIPIRGYLLAGSDEHSAAFEPASLPLPDFILRDHPRVFGLLVSGTSLETQGIQDGDLVLVDPLGEFANGSVQIVQVANTLFAFLVRISGVGAVELIESTQAAESFSREELNILGRVVWLIRKIT